MLNPYTSDTMHTITRTLLLFLGGLFGTIPFAYSQEPASSQTMTIPVETEEVTSPKNTFVDYHGYILNADDFRFRKELKKVKYDADYLEYASADNNIRISKRDYLKLLRWHVNQSDSKQEFVGRIAEQFADSEQQFTQTLDLESIYDSTRPHTFHGYFDGLPRIYFN